MSQRAMQWTLWAVLICTVPLPYFMIETGRITAAQLFIFAAVTTPLLITDPGFTTNFVAALFIAQSLFYGAILLLVARFAARRVRPRHRALLVAVVAGVMVVLALFDVYRAPLSNGPGSTNIFGVYR